MPQCRQRRIEVKTVISRYTWRPHLVVWLLALCLLGLSWGFVLVKIDADRSATLANAERDLANLTRVTQEHALRTFQSAEQLLRLVQARYEAAGDIPDLNVLAQQGLANSEIFNLVGIIDAEGYIVLGGSPRKRGTAVGDREHFKVHVAADSGKVFVSPPFFGRISGQWSIVLSRRINTATGAFAGVAFVALRADYFTRFYGELDLGKSGVSALMGQDGIVRARRSGEGQDQFGTDVSASPLLTKLRAGAPVALERYRAISDGVERSYHLRPVAPYALAVSAGKGTAEMLAVHEKNRESLLLAAGFANLLILALAMAFSLHESAARPRSLPVAGLGSDEAALLLAPKRALRILFAALALLVPLLGWLMMRLNTPQLERDTYGSLDAIVSLKAEAIESWLGERYGDAVMVGRSADLMAGIAALLKGSGQGDESVREHLQALRDVYSYANIQLLDRQGVSRFSLTRHNHVPEQTRALVGKALASGQTQFTGLYVDPIDGEPQMDFIVPLFNLQDGRRQAIGAMLLHSDPRHFLFPGIQRWPTASPSGETLLARRDGDSLLFLSPMRHGTVQSGAMPLPLAGPSGTMTGKDYRDIPVLAAFRPIKGTDWLIVSKLDRDEVFSPLWRRVGWVCLALFAALGMIGVGLHLLARQQARAQQYEAQASRLLKHFFELPFIGMAISSPETRRWLKFNERLCEILGYPASELPGKTWDEITHPDDLAADLREFGCVLRGESEGYKINKRFIRKDGATVYCELSVRCVRRLDQSVDFILATIQDVSEQTRAGQELLRSNSELEQFSYSISHDMRQPLRMIASYLQLLDRELAAQLDREQREYLDFALEGARRLDQMLVDLLEYSRVGRLGEPACWLESRAALDEALCFLTPAIAEAQAEVQVSGDWPRLLVSPDEFLRLLQNLIGNALKFRVAGRLPQIVVAGETLDRTWRLTVSDNGIGIIPTQIGRLFKVFQRLQSRADYEGTGIGLALCRRIVEHHGGDIRAASAGEGMGSCFMVDLPLHDNAPTAGDEVLS
jgi:PAS domain S-box-containing protein